MCRSVRFLVSLRERWKLTADRFYSVNSLQVWAATMWVAILRLALFLAHRLFPIPLVRFAYTKDTYNDPQNLWTFAWVSIPASSFDRPDWPFAHLQGFEAAPLRCSIDNTCPVTDIGAMYSSIRSVAINSHGTELFGWVLLASIYY